MEQKKSYYLLVLFDSIYSKQSKNKTTDYDNHKSREIFTKYKIPTEFRKIIIKVTVGSISEPVDAFELVTNKMFFFKMPFFKSVLNPTANPIIELSTNDLKVLAINKLYHAETVKKFYKDIIDNGLAKNYGNAVRETLCIQKEEKKQNIFTKIKKKK